MTILMWWGYSWHATFPNPPLHITDGIDQLLKYHDDTLYSHLRRLSISPGLISWAMLSTLFTEILGREDWLKLMDNIFTHFGNSKLVLAVPVAILRAVRTSLLLAGDSSHLVGYCRHQQGVNIGEVISTAHFMCENTPAKYFSACPQQTLTAVLKEEAARQKRGKTLAPQQLADNHAAGQENMALHAGSPIFPLSMGRYPAYDGHPRFLVDWELKKRDKALALQQEVDRREDVLITLQAKVKVSLFSHLFLTVNFARFRRWKMSTASGWPGTKQPQMPKYALMNFWPVCQVSSLLTDNAPQSFDGVRTQASTGTASYRARDFSAASFRTERA
jgi:hypothetical protein